MSAPSRAQTSEMSRPIPGPMPETTTILSSSITAPACPRRGPVSAPRTVHTKNDPQFTSSDCPVIALDRSEAKKTTASAISAEVAMRLRADSAARSSWTVLIVDAALLGHLAEPEPQRLAHDVAGHDGVDADVVLAEHRGRASARPSSARTWTRRRCRGRAGCARIARVPVITIEPPPPSRIAGMTACVMLSVPPRLMRIACWICRSVASDSGTSWPPVAALLTSTSTRPNCSSVRSTRLRHWSASVTSVGTESVRRPSACTSAATASERRLRAGGEHDVGAVARTGERDVAAHAGSDA